MTRSLAVWRAKASDGDGLRRALVDAASQAAAFTGCGFDEAASFTGCG
jgi:hypothetical protein